MDTPVWVWIAFTAGTGLIAGIMLGAALVWRQVSPHIRASIAAEDADSLGIVLPRDMV